MHGTLEGYRAITVTRCSPTVGAEIGNIDLTRPLSELELAELKRAFTENLVIFFRNQKISFEDHVRLAEYFGPVGEHVGKKTHSKASDDARVRKFHFDESSKEISGNAWHTDQSCAPIPPLGSILYMHTVPPNGGGDTMFVSMYAAYEALSPAMKAFLTPLTAVHDGNPVYKALFPDSTKIYPRNSHPVVRTHPVTGRKLIYVNGSYTTRINELSEEESNAVLRFLWEHVKNPNFHVRFRWQEHSVAFWDNRCTQHFAVWDYFPDVRSGFRVTVAGDKPF